MGPMGPMGRMGCDRRWGIALLRQRGGIGPMGRMGGDRRCCALLGQLAGWRWWRCVSGAGVVALLGQRLPIGLIGPIIPIGLSLLRIAPLA